MKLTTEEVKDLTSVHGTPILEKSTQNGGLITTIFRFSNGTRIKTIYNIETDILNSYLLAL